MSWRDRLQPASFRGVPFVFDSGSQTGGRRNAVHEYPGQDRPWIEDMGRKARRFTVDGFLVGDDYDRQRDALVAALEQSGAGELIHPRYGALLVSVEEFSLRETTREGGHVTVSITLVEAGEREFPATTVDTFAEVSTGVDTGLAALTDDFVSGFNVNGLPGWVASESLSVFDAGLTAAAGFLPSISAGPDALFSATRSFDLLTTDLPGLLTTPATLADRVVGSLGGLFDGVTGATVPRLIDDAVGAAFSALPAVPLPTQSRVAQGANQSAISSLITGATALLATGSIAGCTCDPVTSVVGSVFTSRQHAWSVRDDLVDRLDAIGDAGSDALFAAVRDVKPALVRHINAHGFDLASATEYTAKAGVPALVLSHQLYGTAHAEQDLIIRNAMRNPGAVAAGVALEVLSHV